MTKEDVIKYLKDNPRDIMDVADAFNLKVKYESFEDMRLDYQIIKRRFERAEKAKNENPSDESLKQIYKDAWFKLHEFEEMYHWFEPHFDKEMEKRWVGDMDDIAAENCYKFRKRIYNTQRIKYDELLSNIVTNDMCKVWNTLNIRDEDDIYEAYPITITYDGEIDEFVDFCNQRECNGDSYRVKNFMKRSYYLDSDGGLAIIEIRTRYINNESGDEFDKIEGYQILTLGEDDCNHFLNSSRIYEVMEGTDGNEFADKLTKLLEEFRKCENSVK